MRRTRSGVPALLVALLACAAPSARAATLSNWSPGQACPDVMVLGARGSGQEDGHGGIPADSATAGLGAEVYGFASHLADAVTDDNKTVAGWTVSYPAISLGDATGDLLFESIDQGVSSVQVQVAAIAGQCRSHHTQIVLAGYSQGAAVVREGAVHVRAQDTDMLAGMVLIADPYNDPAAGGLHIGTADGSRTGVFGGQPADARTPAFLRSRTVYVCDAGDPVCDSDSVLGTAAGYVLAAGSTIHGSAYEDAQLQRIEAALIATMLRRQTGAVVGNSSCWTNTLPPNDDGSTGQVDIGFNLNFFGVSFSSLYVNNNGNVTFDAPLSTFTPFQLNTTNRKIIAPFFADVDTRGAGSDPVTYGYGTMTYEGHPAFCVNWVTVGYYSAATDKLNSFQLLLVDRSDVSPGDFDIVMNYDTITWETGSASGGSGGLGGSSARVGYSNGIDRSFELPGSGTNGALLDANAVSGLVHNSRNSSVPGRYLFAVRSGGAVTGHQIAGTVTNDTNGQPVAGAYVSACSSGGACALTTTSAGGAYAIGGLADDHYTVTASPPGNVLPASAAADVAGADVTLNLHVTGPTAPPAGTTIGPDHGSGAGLPVIYWGEPTTLGTDGCAGANAGYTVTIGSSTVASGAMTEGPAGHYTATIPPFYPNHGTAHVRIELTGCDTPSTVNFDVYIDPSGTVQDTHGRPLADATVTLLRANTADGPFAAVDDGSAVMSLANRRNPDSTDAEGHFGWDVIPGFYKVRATKAGCHAPGDPDTAPVETAVLTIPPPVTDLVLVLDCGAADTTAPTVVCAQADGAWHAGNVTIACTASDGGSGLADAGDAAFSLQTSVADGEEIAEAVTGTHEVCDQAGNCETAGPVGGNKVDRRAPQTNCGSADGEWHAGNVTIACTASDGGSGLAHAEDAAFGLATHVDAGAETANAATDSHEVCDAVGHCATAGPVGSNKVDRAAPSLAVPLSLVVNATSPQGAAVTYSVSASDGADANPGVSCAPPPATTFAIGTTTVSCTATDHAGNTTGASFAVKVKSASEQIVDLTNLLRSMFARPALSDSLAAALKQAADAVIQRKPQAACVTLTAFVFLVKFTPNSLLSAANRTLLVAEATRIKAVIGC